MLRAPTRIWAVLLVLLAVGLRLGAGVFWQSRVPAGQSFEFPDSVSYWTLGQRIAAGEPYVYGDARVFRTPGYPVLLAGIFRIATQQASVMWGRALSALLGGAAVAGVICWATLLFDPRAGVLAGLFTTLYPGAIAMGAFVLSEAPFCPLMVLHLALWTLAYRAGTTKRRLSYAALGGVAAGLATLMRPSWLLFTPTAAGLALILGRRKRQGQEAGAESQSHGLGQACAGRRSQLAIAIVMWSTLALTMLPWWARNMRVTGHAIATTLQVGASMYDGLNPQADGSSDMTHVQVIEQNELRERQFQPGVEYRLNHRLLEEATSWAALNPGSAAQLAATKFARMWNVWPNDADFRAWPIRLLVAATYLPLLVLGLWGALRFSRLGWPYVLAWLPAVYFSALHMVFVSSIRYREPAMLGLIVLAAGAATSQRQAGWQTSGAR